MNTNIRQMSAKVGVVGMILFSLASLTSCNDDNVIGENPYAGGREPISVKLLDKNPNPASAAASEEVTFYAAGLAKYCHPEENRYDFDFYISDEKAQVLNANDSLVTIRVPENVSSGLAYIVVENQIFFGPNFKILGSVSVDEGFSYYKTNGKLTGPIGGNIYDLLPWSGNNELLSRFYLAGNFRKSSDLKNDDYFRGGLAMVTNKDGQSKWDVSYFKASNCIYLSYGTDNNNADDGVLVSPKGNGLAYMRDEAKNPSVLIYGFFNKFEDGRYNNPPYNNLNLLKNDMSMATTNRNLANDEGGASTVSLPTFTGGTSGEVVRAWGTTKGQIVAVGNFTLHRQIDYENSLWSSSLSRVEAEYKETYQPTVTRMDKTGVCDTLFRRGAQYTGVMGTIIDACQLDNDDMVLVGEFNAFDGTQVSNIVKLKEDGNIDEAFMAMIGAGADGPINQISYFKATDREYIVMTGQFHTFNGQECDGLVVLNADGSFDPDFKSLGFEGGYPNFAKIVDINGRPKMIVSGTFGKYNGIVRRGFLMLELTGESIQGFNVSGQFSGRIYDAAYSLTSDNMNGVLLVGAFSYFDGQPANNVVMLRVELDQ